MRIAACLAGIAAAIFCKATPRTIPVGAPLVSRSTSGKSSLRLARLNACEFANAVVLSELYKNIGLSGEIASRAFRSGSCEFSILK